MTQVLITKYHLYLSLSSSSVHLIRQIFSWDQVELLSCMERMGARQEEHLHVPTYMMHVWWMNRRWWLLGRWRVIHHSWMDDQLLCQNWSGETVANEKRCTWTMRAINGAFLRHSSSRSHSSTYNNSSSSATYTTVIFTPNCGQKLVLCRAGGGFIVIICPRGFRNEFIQEDRRRIRWGSPSVVHKSESRVTKTT